MRERAAKRININAQQRLSEVVREYFLDLHDAVRNPDRRIAWCTSVGPCEILTAFGFSVYFPENHGAIIGARKMSHEVIPHAVGAGYASESCSYMTSDIGAALSDQSPLREIYGIDGPPAPDLLVYNTNQCREVQDWFNFFGRRHRAPVMGINPPRFIGKVIDDHVAFVRGEFVRLIRDIESHFDRRLDWNELEAIVSRSSRVSTLWGEILDTARSRPSPITFWDGLIHMSPIILLRGFDVAIDYYERLLEEMQQRVRDGVGAVPGERWRLYWDGMPVWPKLRALSEKFFDLKAVIAASTYCNSWAVEPYEGGDPLEWMARVAVGIFINRDESYKQSFLLGAFERFEIDGAIFHNARTCPNNTNSRFGMPDRLRKDRDMPILVLDGDLSDVRFFSTAQTMTNIEAFIEQLEERCR